MYSYIYAIAHIDSGIKSEDVYLDKVGIFPFLRLHFGADWVNNVELPINDSWLSSDLKMSMEDDVIDLGKFKDRLMSEYGRYASMHGDSIPECFHMYEINFHHEVFDVFDKSGHDTLLTIPQVIADFGRYIATGRTSEPESIIDWRNPKYRILKVLEYHI